MGIIRRILQHCLLASAVLFRSEIVVGSDVNVKCSCVTDGPRTATLVLADGASGSTWLGQMLDNHPCSSAFVHNSTRLDGKAYINSIRELADMLQENKRAASVMQPTAAVKSGNNRSNGSNLSAPSHPRLGYGLVVPWQAIDKLLHESSRRSGPRGGASSTISSSRHHDDHLLPELHIVVLLRDPFFWVLSQVKKLALRSDTNSHSKDGVKCTNIHQRGTALCPITSHYQFAPDPVILDHRIKEFEARIELMRAVGAAAALRWGPKPQLPPTTPHATAARSHDGGEGCNEPASKQLQTFSSIPGLNDNQTKASNCREETLKRRAVTKNINNYAELDYGELLCAGSALGQNALPRYLSQFVGLGTCTASEHAAAAALEGSSRDHRRLGSHHQRLSNSRHQNQPSGHCRRLRASRSRRPSPGADTTAANTQSQPPLHPIPPPLSSSRDHSAVVAVKTSPSAVRQELKNWAEIMVWAIDHAAPWRNRLKLKSESALLGNCSRAVSDPRAGLPFPPTLVRPSLASPSSSSNKLRTVVAAAAAADSPQISRAPLSEASSSFSSSSASELPSGYHGLDLTALASLSHLTKARANLHRLHDEYLAMASGSSTHPKKSSRGHGKRGKHEHD